MRSCRFTLLSLLFFAWPATPCSLKKEIGQLFVVSIPAGSQVGEFKSFAKDSNIGGVMLFNWNLDSIKNPNDMIALTNQLQEGMQPAMFIAADQEGGLIQRLNKSRGFTMLPSAARTGTAGESYAYEVGRIMGHELKSVGVNWNFAPSVDIATDPQNPVVAQLKRAYSNDPNLVAQHSAQIIRGMQEKGLMTTAKHFPGHGRTLGGDSHASAVVIDKPWEEIVKTELVPFIEAINRNVSSIMVGHINVPAMCTEPASLSQKLLDGVLRKQLGFKGLIVTDDLSMGAITSKYTLGEAAERAILAGNDILLANFGTEKEMIDHLCKATEAGDEKANSLKSRIIESFDRIQKTKKTAGIEPHQTIPALAEPLSTLEHQQLSAKIFELSGGLPAGVQGPIDASKGLKDLMGNP